MEEDNKEREKKEREREGKKRKVERKEEGNFRNIILQTLPPSQHYSVCVCLRVCVCVYADDTHLLHHAKTWMSINELNNDKDPSNNFFIQTQTYVPLLHLYFF